MIKPPLTAALLCAAALVAVVPAQAAKGKRPAAAQQQLPDASPAQLEAAKLALQGTYECEFKQTLTLLADPAHPGYLRLSFKKDNWIVKPTLTDTGTVRIEDVKGRTLLMQIAFKSMLMDVKAGRRIVDNCVHPSQRAAEQASQGQPAAKSLF